MRWLRWLGIGQEADDHRVEGSDEDAASPAVEYVEWLLGSMFRTSRTEATVDTQRTLPGAGNAGEGSPSIPDTASVINRLKVLSGLSPIRYDEPASGGFECPKGNCVITVDTRFTDSGKRSTCRLRISVRARSR